MLMGALAIFTLVAGMGVMIVLDVLKRRPVEPAYPKLHAVAALLGSALVIVAALQGDTRLYANIAMAVVIIALGLIMAVASKRGKRVPKLVVVAHGGLAVVCYVVLAFFALNPYATLEGLLT